MKSVKNSFIVFLVITLLISFVGPTATFANQSQEVPPEPVFYKTGEKIDGDHVDPFVYDILSAIENVPEELILQGDETAIAEWFEETSGIETRVVNGVLRFNPFGNQLSFNVFTCVGAIGVAIVSNGIPLTKILKVKKFIDQFGGTTKFVKSVKYWYDYYRDAKYSRTGALKQAVKKVSDRTASSTQEALLDFFHISTVIGACS